MAPFPDESTIGGLRHLPKDHNLCTPLLATNNATVATIALAIETGTAGRCCLGCSAQFHQKQHGSRDPEMYLSKKDSQCSSQWRQTLVWMRIPVWFTPSLAPDNDSAYLVVTLIDIRLRYWRIDDPLGMTIFLEHR